VAAVSRTVLFVLSGGLAVCAGICLYLAVTLLPNIRSYVGDNYQQYAGSGNDQRYACSGSPDDVADDLVGQQDPDAQADDKGVQYLRYDDDVVIVGPDGNRPCTIRVQGIDAGYNQGSFVFLGPGFFAGSPSGSAGGSSGGPDGAK
jgi:hypothetical protein